MQKKVLCFGFICLMSISLIGCNGKIDNNKAEETLNNAIENTYKKLEELSDANKTYFTFDLDINYSSKNIYSKQESNFYIEGQGNLDLEKLNDEIPDATGSEFYIYSKSYEKSELTDSGISGPGNYLSIEENTISLQNNYYKEYAKNETSDYGFEYPVNETNTKSLANEILTIINQISNLRNYNYGEYYEYQNILMIQEKVDDFLHNKITSRELLSLLESIEIIPNRQDNEWIIYLFDLILEVNPRDYFSYTKTKKSKITTINAVFNYDNWHEQFLNCFNEKTLELDNDFYIEQMSLFTNNLPSNLDLSYATTINKDNYISSYESSIKVIGPKNGNEPSYNVDLQIKANLNLSNKKVIVKSLDIPLNSLIVINKKSAVDINQACAMGTPFTYEELVEKYGDPTFEIIVEGTGVVVWALGCKDLDKYLYKSSYNEPVPTILVTFTMGFASSAEYGE